MESYLMMLYVTVEQESALKTFFLKQGWVFCKPDLSVTTDKIGPSSGVSFPSDFQNRCSDSQGLEPIQQHLHQAKSGKRKLKQIQRPDKKIPKTATSRKNRHISEEIESPRKTAEDSVDEMQTDLLTGSGEQIEKEHQTNFIVKIERVDSENYEDIDDLYDNESTDIDESYQNAAGGRERKGEKGEGEVQQGVEFSQSDGSSEHKADSHTVDQQTKYRCFNLNEMMKTGADPAHFIAPMIHVPVICKECGLSCPSKSALKAHISDEHVDSFPFMCLACGNFFKHKKNMLRHQKSCDVIREFTQEPLPICDDCGKSFKSQYTLKLHMKYVHGSPGSQQFACDVCGNCFSRRYSLTRHKQQKHPGCE